MSTVKNLKKVIQKETKNFSKRSYTKNESSLTESLRKSGNLKKPGYSFPLQDTLGRKYYADIQNCKKVNNSNK